MVQLMLYCKSIQTDGKDGVLVLCFAFHQWDGYRGIFVTRHRQKVSQCPPPKTYDVRHTESRLLLSHQAYITPTNFNLFHPPRTHTTTLYSPTMSMYDNASESGGSAVVIDSDDFGVIAMSDSGTVSPGGAQSIRSDATHGSRKAESTTSGIHIVSLLCHSLHSTPSNLPQPRTGDDAQASTDNETREPTQQTVGITWHSKHPFKSYNRRQVTLGVEIRGIIEDFMSIERADWEITGPSAVILILSRAVEIIGEKEFDMAERPVLKERSNFRLLAVNNGLPVEILA